MKKLIGGVLAAALLVSPFTQTTFANELEQDYTDPYYNYYAEDIDGHWAENDMKNMLHANIIKGVRDAEDFLYLQPDKSITRAEFTVLVVRALELKTDQQGKAFTDTQKHWAKNDINTANVLGIVSGKSDTEFKPDMKITRAEIAAIVARAFEATVTFENGTPKTFEDLKPGHWAYNHVRMVNQVGIIKGTSETTVSPDKNANRAEATAMLKRALWLEDVNLPDQETTMDLVYNSEADTVDAIMERNADSIYAINDSARYGLGHDMGQMDAEMFEEIFAADEEVVAELVSEPTLEVVHRSTRFVELNVQDLLIDYYFTDYETGELDEEPYTEDKSGKYFLIKRNGEWKIYSSDFYNDFLSFEL
ncbi:S-layer homology domain-containing protein [Fictibacillus sp. NPDC058756]|uniref:S-layer homology domain-containing protein n=1 Tax=Fictibacillus sp. NPDC058756 TaxID=3346625 RepID=UPI00369771BE